MKTVTYTISEQDKKLIQADYKKTYRAHEDYYHENPSRFGESRSLLELKKLWSENASAYALFRQFERDGLAHVTKERDEHYTFKDYKGDCFDPTVNTDIDPQELKRQERKERARFNRQGVYYHELVVCGVAVNDCATGGFVGNDFFGSGYDIDFYNCAIEELSKAQPEYIAQAKAAI